MTVQVVERSVILDKIKYVVYGENCTLREFVERGEKRELDNPVLYDLWFIWGSVVREEDLIEEDESQTKAAVRQRPHAAADQLRRMRYTVTHNL